MATVEAECEATGHADPEQAGDYSLGGEGGLLWPGQTRAPQAVCVYTCTCVHVSVYKSVRVHICIFNLA